MPPIGASAGSATLLTTAKKQGKRTADHMISLGDWLPLFVQSITIAQLVWQRIIYFFSFLCTGYHDEDDYDRDDRRDDDEEERNRYHNDKYGDYEDEDEGRRQYEAYYQDDANNDDRNDRFDDYYNDY